MLQTTSFTKASSSKANQIQINHQINHQTQTNQSTVTVICCSNCGSKAERIRLIDEKLTRTQCQTCDYLLITCDRTGKVIEAYAPGIYARH
jgi:DNA-directed RNA polymerase subunit RPC12/RpoP